MRNTYCEIISVKREIVTKRYRAVCAICGEKPIGHRLKIISNRSSFSYPVQNIYCIDCGDRIITKNILKLKKIRNEIGKIRLKTPKKISKTMKNNPFKFIDIG